jgi:lipocalin
MNNMKQPVTALFKSLYEGTWYFVCSIDKFDAPQKSQNLIQNVIQNLKEEGYETMIKDYESIYQIPEYITSN